MAAGRTEGRALNSCPAVTTPTMAIEHKKKTIGPRRVCPPPAAALDCIFLSDMGIGASPVGGNPFATGGADPDFFHGRYPDDWERYREPD